MRVQRVRFLVIDSSNYSFNKKGAEQPCMRLGKADERQESNFTALMHRQ